MRISVNLASRPFVELRPFFARLRLFMAILAVAAIAMGVVAHSMQKKLRLAQAQMDDLRYRTIALQQEKQSNEARMRQPNNSAILDRSHFLNALFLRKSFSWTAVMMDLETVLPTGVQVTSIEPAPQPDGDVQIKLHVSGERDRAILLVRNLERSRRFLLPRLNSETSQAKAASGAPLAAGVTPGVEFEILANYNPLPEGESFVGSAAPAHTSRDARIKNSAAPSAPATAGTPHHPASRTPRPGPHDGIILKPFTPARPSATPTPPQGAPR